MFGTIIENAQTYEKTRKVSMGKQAKPCFLHLFHGSNTSCFLLFRSTGGAVLFLLEILL